MSKITKIDKEALKGLKDEVLAALEQVSIARGVKFRFAGGSFNPQVATLKLDIFLPGESGNETPERVAFRRMAACYSLTAEHLDKAVTVNGVAYTIIGLKQGRSAYPIVVQRTRDGKTFRMKVEWVRRALGLAQDVDRLLQGNR